MTREDIIRMAHEANIGTYINLDSHLVGNHLELFAALVAAKERELCKNLWEALDMKDGQIADCIEGAVLAERERCAEMCDMIAANSVTPTASECAYAIRNKK